MRYYLVWGPLWYLSWTNSIWLFYTSKAVFLFISFMWKWCALQWFKIQNKHFHEFVVGINYVENDVLSCFKDLNISWLYVCSVCEYFLRDKHTFFVVFQVISFLYITTDFYSKILHILIFTYTCRRKNRIVRFAKIVFFNRNCWEVASKELIFGDISYVLWVYNI